MKLVKFNMQTMYQELGTFIALACEKCKTFVKPWHNLALAHENLSNNNQICWILVKAFKKIIVSFKASFFIICNDFRKLHNFLVFFCWRVSACKRAREQKIKINLTRAWHDYCMCKCVVREFM